MLPLLLVAMLSASSHVSATPADGFGAEVLRYYGQDYCAGLTPPQTAYSYTDGNDNYFCGCTTATVSTDEIELCPYDCLDYDIYEGNTGVKLFTDGGCLPPDYGLNCDANGVDISCTDVLYGQQVTFDNGCPLGQKAGISTDGVTCICTSDPALQCVPKPGAYTACAVTTAIDSAQDTVAPYPLTRCGFVCQAG
ncbi:hypothetical protein MNV49_001646 [Pseudohyphozyma bogoriensis]|nr:hypothetical protein MNV49_001646 [Pseudohyphozyma bogoriensis]